MSYRLVSFDDVALPTSQAQYGMPTSVRVSELQLSGAHGAFDLGGSRSNFDVMEISADYLHVPNVKDCDNLFGEGAYGEHDKLRAKLGRYGRLIAEFDKGDVSSRRFVNAKLVSVEPRSDVKLAYSGLLQMRATWRAKPFWYEEAETVATFYSANSIRLVNTGNVDSLAIKLTTQTYITSALTITNETNGMAFTYGAIKNYGQTLAIDCLVHTVTVDGVNAYGNTSRADTQIEFLALAPGMNKLTFSMAISGEIRYRSCWA
jgi:hypothetical protein